MLAIDECGFKEQPLRKRTWAIRGQTSVLRQNGSWKTLTAIGAISLQPSGRLNEQFQLLAHTAKTMDFVWFLRKMRNRYRQKLLVVWDNLKAHRCAAQLLQSLGVSWVEFVWLPSYSPELNPVEWLWNNTKYHELANYAPPDSDTLRTKVAQSLSRPKKNPSLLRSFFRGAGLRINPKT
ncbi:hypothetical protein Pla8534_64710 [Lignipirellula cremea]|uniref:Tc1-like transposase DDE domain-containing protein n=1 Tax=Lignipirellula cremea TaxID=2528010 RepID=A0A518E3D5_9BACT|nr:hypothetical protein Pla8534_64710 [Lignipirellula cremea]